MFLALLTSLKAEVKHMPKCFGGSQHKKGPSQFGMVLFFLLPSAGVGLELFGDTVLMPPWHPNKPWNCFILMGLFPLPHYPAKTQS